MTLAFAHNEGMRHQHLIDSPNTTVWFHLLFKEADAFNGKLKAAGFKSDQDITRDDVPKIIDCLDGACPGWGQRLTALLGADDVLGVLAVEQLPDSRVRRKPREEAAPEPQQAAPSPEPEPHPEPAIHTATGEVFQARVSNGATFDELTPEVREVIERMAASAAWEPYTIPPEAQAEANQRGLPYPIERAVIALGPGAVLRLAKLTNGNTIVNTDDLQLLVQRFGSSAP